MAARLRRDHQQSVRDKIQASQLLNRVQNHALGNHDITDSQLKGCIYLLDKLLPDAPKETHVSAPDGGPVAIKVLFGG